MRLLMLHRLTLHRSMTVLPQLTGNPGRNSLRNQLLGAAVALAITLLSTSSAAMARATFDEDAAKGDFQETLTPSIKHARTAEEILIRLQRTHYEKRAFDDQLSSQLLDEYLDNLDPGKIYFTQADVARFDAHRFMLDDGIRRGNLQPSFDIFNFYRGVAISTAEWVLKDLEQRIDAMDFSRDESIVIDSDKLDWPANQAERLDRVRKVIKNAVISLQLADKEPDDIIETISKRYNNQLTRLRQMDTEDAFQVYINSLAALYDPHTSYMSPRTSENFSINMSLSLEGIGAVLKSDGEYTVVEELVKGGPAELQGELKNKDRIVGVGQGEKGEIEDVVGWRLDEVVDQIRGKKNTVVRLEVIPDDSAGGVERKVIQITRNKVKLEAQAAQKKELDLFYNDEVRKIGVIQIPTFYHDYQAQMRGEKDYRSTTRDVKNLLDELDAAGAEGVIIDLRGNGGGYLEEAQTLIGLFVERGPVVQIKGSNGKIKPFNNYPNPDFYTKPVAVLIDRLSASASEIFAGAIQDYNRGLVIGSPSFGKGTVQNVTDLNHGQLKLTTAKYYRISGESTQHRGVVPDILLPSVYDIDDIGEATLDRALTWDTVKPLRFRNYGDFDALEAALTQRHKERVKEDPDYRYLIDRLALGEKYDAIETLPLNREQRKKMMEEDEAARDALENALKLAKGLPLNDDADKDNDEGDGSTVAKEDASEKSEDADPRSDFLLNESGFILLDSITLGKEQLAQTPSQSALQASSGS